MRKLLVFLCLTMLAFATQVPRTVADVTIDPPPGGKPIPIKSYRGKTLVIAILSTECQECAESVGVLNRVQNDYKAKGVQVLAAAVNEGAISLIGSFIARYRPSFPIGVLGQDATRRLADFGTDERPYVPIFIFVDPSGTVRAQAFGASEFFQNGQEEASTRKTLDQMLKK